MPDRIFLFMGDIMKSKAFIFTTIFVVFVLLLLVAVSFVLPKSTKDVADNTSSFISTSSAQDSVTVADLVNASDTVISGTVIKADVDATGVLYTFQVLKVYKGRNYSSMGYAYVSGGQSLQFSKSYLFFGVTGEEKYHYYEPFDYAPWVFEITENGLISASNSSTHLEDLESVTLEKVQEMCNVK